MIKKICFHQSWKEGQGDGKVFVMTALGSYEARHGVCLPTTSTSGGREVNVSEQRGSYMLENLQTAGKKKTVTFTDGAFIQMKSSGWIVLYRKTTDSKPNICGWGACLSSILSLPSYWFSFRISFTCPEVSKREQPLTLNSPAGQLSFLQQSLSGELKDK